MEKRFDKITNREFNVAIIGSRTFNDFKYAESVINDIISDSYISIKCIISGGALGADTIAREYAKKYDLPIHEIKPNWKIGKHAGFLRNTDIVNTSDIVIAFWDGMSEGTLDSIKKARKTKKIVYVIEYKNVKSGLPFG